MLLMLAESCQLLRRHWSITYSDGRTEVVDGEGVIGEQPTIAPGDLYQYSSCTMFDKEEYCQMEGYFLMKYLNTGEQYTYYRLHVARKFGGLTVYLHNCQIENCKYFILAYNICMMIPY